MFNLMASKRAVNEEDIYISQLARVFHPPKCIRGNCGKVIGQIVDYKTGKPVGEKFAIYVALCGIEKVSGIMGIIFDGQTDKDGRFSFEIDEGKYCFYYYPLRYDSKYGAELPKRYGYESDEFEVYKGKITKLIRVARLGGDIKVKFVDERGRKVKFKEFFKLGNREEGPVCLRLYNDQYSDKVKSNLVMCDSTERFDNGGRFSNYMFFNLPPGTYDGMMEFYGMEHGRNYASQFIEGIKVEGGKVTTIEVELSRRTGVKGRVTDMKGKPLEDVKCVIYNDYYEKKRPGFIIIAKAYTDNEGNYELYGFKELDNPYKAVFYYEKNGKKYNKSFKLKIIEGKVLKRDIRFDITE